MKINLYRNRYSLDGIEKYIIEAYNYAVNYLKLPCSDLEVNISFVSKDDIRELNRVHRDKDSITDVLSFPTLLRPNETDMHLLGDTLTKDNFALDIDHETGNIVLGDICICMYQAKKQAKDFGNSNEREITYLAVHGLLHLLGYDHIKDSDKAIMRKAEEDIMTKVKLERD